MRVTQQSEADYQDMLDVVAQCLLIAARRGQQILLAKQQLNEPPSIKELGGTVVDEGQTTPQD